jgi:hypothetical protein
MATAAIPTIERILADLEPEVVYFFALVSRVHRTSLVAASQDPARPCYGQSIDCQGCSAIRNVDILNV